MRCPGLTQEIPLPGLAMLLRVLGSLAPCPVMVFVKLPVVLSGDTVLTTEGRGQRLYEMVKAAEKAPGLVSFYCRRPMHPISPCPETAIECRFLFDRGPDTYVTLR
eukprot:2054706-Rhodomonas_salina.1